MYQIKLEKGQDALPSKVGALCSLLLFVVMIVFTGYKISILNDKKSIDIIQAVKENHYDEHHVFSAKQGLNFAVGVYWGVDPSTNQLLDPSYGRLKFTKYTV